MARAGLALVAAAAVLAVALLAGPVAACTINNITTGATNFDCLLTMATLETEHVVPAPGGSNAFVGTVDLLWGATKMCWQLNVPSYPLPIGAASLILYKGVAGINGPEYVNIFQSSNKIPPGGCQMFGSDLVSAQLFTNPSAYYAVLSYPGVTARGQIMTEPRLLARMESALISPPPVGPSIGNAFGDIFYQYQNNSYGPQICYFIKIDSSIDVATITSINIFAGSFGVVPNTTSKALMVVYNGAPPSSTVTGCTKTNAAVGYLPDYPVPPGQNVEFLGSPARAQPIAYFMDIRTTANPKGVCRGQLETKVPLMAALSGPGGSASVRLVLGNGGIAYTFSPSGNVGTPLELHITDLSSPPSFVIIVAKADVNNSLNFASSGYTNVPSQDTLTSMLRIPSNYRVVLHTLENLGGAMSGTLVYVPHTLAGGQCCDGT
eukprot:SM000004S14898  [mRNA]  locus=s4:100200:103255:+ [translate_table: standard]